MGEPWARQGAPMLQLAEVQATGRASPAITAGEPSVKTSGGQTGKHVAKLTANREPENKIVSANVGSISSSP